MTTVGVKGLNSHDMRQDRILKLEPQYIKARYCAIERRENSKKIAVRSLFYY